jgi:hypothetical protein
MTAARPLPPSPQLLVRCPTRSAFTEMIADPDYYAADEIRMSALSEAVLPPIRRLSV